MKNQVLYAVYKFDATLVLVQSAIFALHSGTVVNPGGGGGTASLRVGTQNKTTDPLFCATTVLSHFACWFTAPCFQGIKGQPIVITAVAAVCPSGNHFQLS